MKFLILLFAATFVISTVQAEEDTKLVALCKKQSKIVLKGMMKKFTGCTKEITGSEPDPNKAAEIFAEKVGCVVRCVMKKENVLDPNDIMTEETVRDAVEMRVPESYQKHIHELIMTCVKSHGADKLDPNDPHCKTYAELGYCLQEALADVCGNLPPM